MDIYFKNLIDLLNEYGELLVTKYKLELKSFNKNATFDLYNSVKYIYTNNDNTYEISLNLAYYWKYVEFGRKSGKFPPISKIKNWINVKKILPTERNGKLPTVNQLAYLIARKISKKGINPTYLLTKTIEEINEIYFVKIKSIFKNDVEVIINNLFKELNKRNGQYI